MRIGFVAEPYEEHNASGMGFVIAELLREILKQGAGKHEFVVYSTAPVSRSFIPGEYREVRLPRGFLRKIYWFWRMPKEVDVLLFSAPMMPLILPRGIHPIVVCQELPNHHIAPDGLLERAFIFLRDDILMRLSFRRAYAVAAASRSTQSDILHFYALPTDKVPVIYDGYQDLSRYAAVSSPISEELKPYFFFAGRVKYRKNIHGIAEAFTDFKRRTNAPAHLVIAGDFSGEYYRKIHQNLRDAGLGDYVHFVGYIDGPQLYAYFKNALAVTFPSINEGFGMPVIEAMSVGTPVITSKISSMAEAAGEAALLVDPFDVADISRAMERIYNDSALREELIEKGHRRSKDFSWQKAGREFLALAEKTQ